MASLSLPGFSITVLLLPRESKAPTSYETKLSFDKDFLLELFDAPTDAPGWRWAAKQAPESHVVEEKERTSKADAEAVKGPAPVDAKMFLDAIKNALKHVIAAEPEITKYDQIAGDGDAGVTLKQGAEGIEGKLGTSELSDKDVVAAMVCISEVVETEMGGTSGGLYSIFFSALSKGLLEAAKEKSSDRATAEVWARGLEVSLVDGALYTVTNDTCILLSTAGIERAVHIHPCTPALTHARRPSRRLHRHILLRPSKLRRRVQSSARSG